MQICISNANLHTEVDFLVEREGVLIPIEAKATATPLPGHAAPIRELRRVLGNRVAPGYLVHGGEHRAALGDGVTAVPLGAL